MSHWETVIGLEVHVQIATESKAFSASGIGFGQTPNTLTDPTVLGLPGSLPVINRVFVDKAILLALAVGANIRRTSRFARKHYFYPDQPAGYQISQFDEPLCEGGALTVLSSEGVCKVPLTRIHLENDAGKSRHGHGNNSQVDLNRAGIGLCEVVSEPAMHSPAEAANYMRSLRQLVRFLGISEADMEKGQMRCDANVSIRRRGDTRLGVRTELKNINSFRFVERALEYERDRHIALLKSGSTPVQETRLWDSEAGVSRRMRGKEDALDYRYFSDPDLPPLVLEEEDIAAAKSSLPELPETAFVRLTDGGLELDDALTLTSDPALLVFYDTVCGSTNQAAQWPAKLVWSWMQNLLAELGKRDLSIEDSPLSSESLAQIVELLQEGAISARIGKRVLVLMMDEKSSAREIVEREGLMQISDPALLQAHIDAVIEAGAKQLQAYRDGNAKMRSYFVGQVMKATQGKADPALVNSLLSAILDSK